MRFTAPNPPVRPHWRCTFVAEAQKRGGEAAFVDAEHALDPVYAAALGVDTDNLLVSQPDTGEQALEITEALVRSGAVDVGGCGLRGRAGSRAGDRGRNGRQPLSAFRRV